MADVNSLPQLSWPTVPAPLNAQALLLYQQLDQSQWLPPEKIALAQYVQLKVLLEHYSQALPYWHDSIDSDLLEKIHDPAARLDESALTKLPILHRKAVSSHFAQWPARAHEGHGKALKMTTSGSLGTPASFYRNYVTEIFHQALNLRNHVWQQRDFNTVFASIRGYPVGDAMYPEGTSSTRWSALMQSGKAVTLNSAYCTLEEQLAWLEQQQPDYLISYPTNLAHMCQLFKNRTFSFVKKLKGIATFSEMLSASQRKTIEQGFSQKLVDIYSASETGVIALQCPQHNHYHVMSESLIVEVLNENDEACKSGETGRVVITDLHNFHTPFVRYEIGDYAEVGKVCDCGRGLPVLNRIYGRQRNMLKQADGQLRFPDVASHKLGELGPIKQSRVIQTAINAIELQLVLERPLEVTEEKQVSQAILDSIGHEFTLTIKVMPEIPAGANGKYEDFICKI